MRESCRRANREFKERLLEAVISLMSGCQDGGSVGRQINTESYAFAQVDPNTPRRRRSSLAILLEAPKKSTGDLPFVLFCRILFYVALKCFMERNAAHTLRVVIPAQPGPVSSSDF